MKRNHQEFVENFAQQAKPLEYHISPQSVGRFSESDRIWTIEIWFRIQNPEGNIEIQVWELYPDPCCPHMGETYTQREWRIRKLTLNELGRLDFSECPPNLVTGASTEGDEGRFIAEMTRYAQSRETG